MLIPPDHAAQFLTAYKRMLSDFAGRALCTAEDYVSARNAFFENAAGHKVLAADPDLVTALQTACFGDFVVARHQARQTEMVSPNNGVFRVKGITTELKSVAPEWTVVKTAVMEFKGHWICDGLAVARGIEIGPQMRRDLRSLIDATDVTPRPSPQAAKASSPPAAAFTSKQGQYLAFIYYYSKVNGQPPAESDMVRYFGVSAPSVHQMIVTLGKNRLIERTAGKGRSIRLMLSRDQLPDLE